ncbi:MAG: hypothetical protein AB7T49_19080 [Oligoflexales bacterium]
MFVNAMLALFAATFTIAVRAQPLTVVPRNTDDRTTFLAQEEDSSPKKERRKNKKKKSEPQNEPQAEAQPELTGSRAKRDSSHMYFGARLSPLFYWGSGASVDAYSVFSHKLLLGAWLGHSSVSLDDYEDDEEKEEDGESEAPDPRIEDETTRITKFNVATTHIMGSARWFLGNSFFVGGGAGYRAFTFDAEVESKTTPGSAVQVDVFGQALLVELAVGNLWCFDFGMCIGADWFGATMPVYSSYELNAKATLGEISDEDFSNLEDAVTKVNSSPAYMLLTFNIGFMF